MAQDQSIARLAQYRPFRRGGRDSLDLIGDLVLVVLCEADGNLPSLKSVEESCETLWGLKIEIEELRQVAQALASAERLEWTGTTLALPAPVLAELRLSRVEHEATKKRAIEDWLGVVSQTAPELSSSDMDVLRSDLELWLHQVVRRHGVEAALLLCPEIPRARQVMDDVEAMGLDFLPSASASVTRVRDAALGQFVRRPTPEQRTYLAALLDTAHFLTLLSLDPDSCAAVQAVTSGQSVYIDTNFAYWLLNLSGPRHFLSARRLVEMTTALGYELRVTPWTVRELRRSLEKARNFLNSKPIPPADLAALAAEATTDEDFVTAYWRRIRSQPVSVQDFFEFYSEIESHLERHSVRVVDDGCTAVDRNQEAVDEEVTLFERVLSPRDRALPVKEHDVKHQLLVQRLRGSGARSFASAGFWFLTCDSSLPRYDYVSRQHSGADLPFCFSAATWLQCVRAFTPRTDDLDQTLVDLLATPYVRGRNRVSQETVLEVVARVDLYDGMTPALAARVLLDSALMEDVSQARNEDQKAARIDAAVVAAARDITERLEESERQATAERGARIAAESQAAYRASSLAELQGQLEEERARVRNLGEAMESERLARETVVEEQNATSVDLELVRAQEVRGLRDTVTEQQERVAELERQMESENRRRGRRRKRNWILGLSLVAVALFVAMPVTLVTGFDNNSLEASLAAAGAFFVFAAIAWWKDVKTAAVALGVTGGILTVFATVYAVLG